MSMGSWVVGRPLSSLARPRRLLLTPAATEVLVFSVCVLALVTAAAQPLVPMWELLKDPLEVAVQSGRCCSFHFGLLAVLMSLMWFSTAVVSLLTAILLFCHSDVRQPIRFLLYAGFFSGLLGVDDQFQVHDQVLPWYGISEKVLLAVYFMIALGYVMVSWREILRHRVHVLAIGIAMLTASVAIDVVWPTGGQWRLLAEDGTKALGILGWSLFHISAAYRLVVAEMQQSPVHRTRSAP